MALQTREIPTKASALIAAQACAKLLQEKFGVKRVILFGSLVEQEYWHDRSDIDLAVEGLPEGEFFRAYSACRALLPQALDLDLVLLEDAPPQMRSRILQEIEMPENSLLALKSLVEDELTALERLVQTTQEALGSLSENPSQLELNGLAAYMQQFYTGIESIFRRIAVRVDGSLPRGEHWHIDLLNQMSEVREGVRPALIDEPLQVRLRDYLNFRHFFRHAYGYQLRWNEMRLKVEILAETLEMLRHQLMTFFDEVIGEENRRLG